MKQRYAAVPAGVLATLATAIGTAQVAEPSSPWVAMTHFDITQTIPAQPGVVKTSVEAAANGDARIDVDISNGKQQTKGTILLIAGHWIVTQGLTLESGSEIDLVDIAALNSQLVRALLQAALPKGPPDPGQERHVLVAQLTYPIQVSTTTSSGDYEPPWTVTGTVSESPGGEKTHYQLDFTSTNAEGAKATMRLEGDVSRSIPPFEISDSMPLATWKVHKIGPYEEPVPGGTRLDYGARPSDTTAATVGDLRNAK